MKKKILECKSKKGDCSKGKGAKCYSCSGIDSLNVHFGIMLVQVHGKLLEATSKTTVSNNVSRLLCLAKNFQIGETIEVEVITKFVWEGRPTSLSSQLQLMHQAKFTLINANKKFYNIRGVGYVILENKDFYVHDN
ncbi:hypothetical protein [Shewanella chilikensis]|uniref:hypothetical protein n=1 Tax=Shewanella chilikensis TaxID=558541 RepID=UPI001F1879B1|nr:hypothetical protein [Shewanella chilikensis]MCE9789985.1 hypothetical protein [Shewanella chilikensis]